MLEAFLLGLLLAAAAMLIITGIVLTGIWIKNKVKERLNQKKKHKVAFAETREVVDNAMKRRIEGSKEISMDELEALCDRSPFVMATYDEETDELLDYEGIKPDSVQENVTELIRKNDGLLIIEG